MNRIHTMIAAITLAEKEERQNKKTARQAVLGYDEEKWTKTDLKVRKENASKKPDRCKKTMYHRNDILPIA